MAYITPDDLAAFATIDAAKAAAMVEDASAMAVMAAPCLSDEAALTEAQRAAVKSVLRRAILRWDEAGAGSRKSVTETAGIYGHGETLEVSSSKGLFWPSEIDDLRSICKLLDQAPGAKAFGIDTAPSLGPVHSPVCSLFFGALYCSCGSDINRLEGPLYEGGLLS